MELYQYRKEKSFRFSDVACTTEGHLLPPHVKLCISDYVDGAGVPFTNRDDKPRFTISAGR